MTQIKAGDFKTDMHLGIRKKSAQSYLEKILFRFVKNKKYL